MSYCDCCEYANECELADGINFCNDCKDCVHYEVCKIWCGEANIRMSTDCDFVKNKADFVEVGTIKSWLYEMALNNVGCHIEGDFSTACEEIISRLEGLKKYSIEKEGADNG